MKSTKKIFIILTLIVLLPALFYSVYEISALDDTELMIDQLYQRQLDAVLFSVNQYTLDVASSWATQIENEPANSRYDRLLQANPSIHSIVLTDSAFSTWKSVPARNEQIRDSFRKNKEKIERLIRYQTVSYRKLEPIAETDSTFLILFAPSSLPATIIGIVVNNEDFIRDIIGKKLTDIAQNDFILTVNRLSVEKTVFSTVRLTNEIFSHQRPLWIFPDHVVKIRLRGATIQEAARDRFTTNITLIVILDLILLAGAFFVYRLIKREMELVAMKSDFVSNVSHELRTPLSLIRMFAETLEMKRVPTEKKKQEYYSIILHETERLTRLINNILNFSRMESNSRKYNFRPANINDIISSVLTIYSYRLEQHSFTLETSLDKNLPMLSVDEEAIAEALHNLIDNAIKYSADVKFLRIESLRTDSAVQIVVIDRGIGVATEHQTHIFEKFYRVSHGLVHTAKGTGLGLAIVQHIVHAHHGTITINSESNNGSRFSMTLPLTETI
ncbi:MAG: ATP-binding protein [Bacteroidota bacterium]